MNIVIAFISGVVFTYIFFTTFVKIGYKSSFNLGKTSGYCSGIIKGMKIAKEKYKRSL